MDGAKNEKRVTWEQLQEDAERVRTRQDLVVFARRLSKMSESPDPVWTNASLPDYLEALSGIAKDIDGYYKNADLAIDADQPSWRVFAEVLLAAAHYE
jgi:hypothetical protein